MSESGSSRGLAVRAALLIVRLFPAAFRRRFARDIEAAIADAAAAGTGGVRILGDAVASLGRVWVRRMLESVSIGRPSVAGGVADVRRAARSLVRDPLYSVVIVATLAVAIGANAAVFDVMWSVLLRSLPYAEPERIVSVQPAPIRFTPAGFDVSASLTDVPGVERAAAYTAGGRASLAAGDGASDVSITQVTGEFFEVLGVIPRFGPGLSTAPPDEMVAVLSDGVWRSAFGASPDVVGTTVRLSGHSVLIGGVAPPEVAVPAGTGIWVTYPLEPSFYGAASGAEVIARLESEAVLERTRSEHEARLEAQWSERGDTLPADSYPVFMPLRSALVGPVREALVTLFAAATLVLLLGCLNLAGLTLARRSARTDELALRRALGAGRSRLLRMMLTESLTLALVAAFPAALLAVGGRALLVRLLPGTLPGLSAAAPGLEAIVWIGCATVAAGLLVGVVPAAHALSAASGIGVAGRLRERRRRLHPALVVSEVALAVLLVIGAGLLGRSLVDLRSVPLGYDLDGILTFGVRLPDDVYTTGPAYRAFAEGLRERLAGLPGVNDVGYASRLPLWEGLGVSFRVWPADSDEQDGTESASVIRASDGFLNAFGIPRVAGDGFQPGSRGTVQISRSLAIALFGRADVVGQRLNIRFSTRSDPELATIGGVAGDTRMRGFESAVAHALYLPFDSWAVPWMSFAIRTSADPAALASGVRRALAETDPAVAPFRIVTTRAAARQVIATREALTIASILFGSAALLLSVLGTYGLLSQSVTRRRRELGVRMAIGARAADVLWMVLGEAGRLTAAGVALGILAALALTRLLSSLLWNVQPTDPATFIAVAAIVVASALVAGAVPAYRATRVDPADTLRTQ